MPVIYMEAYGYQMGVRHRYREGMMDQVDRVIYDLRNNPFSRRIMTNLYVHQDLSEMNLYPCAYSMTFNVTQKPGSEKLILNAILNQRSQDILTANNWSGLSQNVGAGKGFLFISSSTNGICLSYIWASAITCTNSPASMPHTWASGRYEAVS